ncbi:MAG: ketoacyl-ACP synthase III [Candidatus Cloacimonetes bacterium]|nr:ketoacyl-ACP synthase III [Candidatus Cloacimonadota bacterium]
MSLITYKDVAIKGISAAVPKRIIDNQDMQGELFSVQEIENAIKTTGIRFRRMAEPDQCSSDLCFHAAEKLLDDMSIDRSSIDLLIFMSQTPDYLQPATAPILQNRLGLSKSCAAFDINLACSGYVYGLSTAFAYCSQEGINRVLLLVGETLTKIISFEDRATSLLFGDGATATLIEKTPGFPRSYFSLNSDGGSFEVLWIEGGAYRMPSSGETLKADKFPDGSVRNKEQLYMDGLEVFNFTMREVPKDIKNLMQFAGIDENGIDYMVLHQANKLMTDFFLKKLKFPKEKAPYSLYNYGNTSAVSIPLTMVSELQNDLQNKNLNLVLSGFGGGLSWGSAFMKTDHIIVPDIVEM